MFVKSNTEYPLPGVPPLDVLTAGSGGGGGMNGLSGLGGLGTESWSDVFKGVFSQFGAAGAKVIGTKYAVPDIGAGTVYQQGPGGTTVSSGVPGTGVLVGSGAGSGGVAGVSSTAILLGVGALALFMFMGRGR